MLYTDPKDLWALLHPVSASEFRAAYWQRAPLYRATTGSVAPSLLAVDEIDSVLDRAAANAGDFDFFSAGSAMPQGHWAGPGNYVLLNRLLGLYAHGGTIHVSNIQKYSPRLSRFCKAVQGQLLVDCEADLWMTKRNDFAPYLHYDRYDIFALQVHGRKRWRLFQKLPLVEGRKSPALAWDEVGSPVIDVIVAPGDLIYIPPHTPHVVTTVDDHSVHVGIGLHPLTWRQVFAIALDESRMHSQELDEVVPLDFMGDLRRSSGEIVAESLRRVGQAVQLVDPERVATKIFDKFLEDVTHGTDSHFATEIFAEQQPIAAGTRVTVREGTFGVIRVQGGRAFLKYSGGGDISGPASYVGAFETMLSGSTSFSANDLDPSLTIEARIELVQRAVDAGFCRRALN